jgi:hypothetical protein
MSENPRSRLEVGADPSGEPDVLYLLGSGGAFCFARYRFQQHLFYRKIFGSFVGTRRFVGAVLLCLGIG